ncbi:MAG: hypothetical protein WB615_00380 [Candidatus Tumulicola sp.]
MAFNPLSSFNQSAAANPDVTAKAEVLYRALPSLPATSITRGYFHWAVAPFGCVFTDYNGMADYENGNWVVKITHNPADNAFGINGNSPAAHTWHRYDGAIGVALAGMTGATQEDFGPDSVTMAGLEHLCAAMAAFALKYDLDASGTVAAGTTHLSDVGTIDTAGEPVLLTHAEAATIDGYLCGFTSDPDCRWDLGSFQPLPSGVSLNTDMVKTCGAALRVRTHVYKTALASAVGVKT